MLILTHIFRESVQESAVINNGVAIDKNIIAALKSESQN